jgi:hypothetical protein
MPFHGDQAHQLGVALGDPAQGEEGALGLVLCISSRMRCTLRSTRHSVELQRSLGKWLASADT